MSVERKMSLMNKPRTLLTILLLSLGLNCVALGVFVSPVMSGREAHPLLEKVMKFAAKLPPELRQSLRQHMRDHREELAKDHRVMQDNRAAILELAKQPQLDETALRAKLDEQRATMSHMISIMQDGVVMTLRDVPPEERVQLAKMLWKDFGFKPPAGMRGGLKDQSDSVAIDDDAPDVQPLPPLQSLPESLPKLDGVLPEHK
jgi:uncharacterized membrane protein